MNVEVWSAMPDDTDEHTFVEDAAGAAEPGGTWDGEAFSPALRPDPPEVPASRELSRAQFFRLFADAEFVAIRDSEDIKVQRLYTEATIATDISLDDPYTIGGIQYLVALEILTAPRATAILAGEAP